MWLVVAEPDSTVLETLELWANKVVLQEPTGCDVEFLPKGTPIMNTAKFDLWYALPSIGLVDTE